MSQNWTARQLAFIEWLAIPTKARKPKTQQSLARKLGVTRETLSRWKKLPGLYDAVYEEARRHLDGRLPNVLDALGDKAEGGDVPAARLALEATGRYVPRRELIGKDESPLFEDVAKPLEQIARRIDSIAPLLRREDGVPSQDSADAEGADVT